MSKDYRKMSNQELFEELDQDNDTGFQTEDLIKIVRLANDPTAWSKPMTGEQLLQEILDLAREIPGGEQVLEELQDHVAKNGYNLH